MALHHHLDKPLMKFSSDLLRPGTETQINLKPVITYTSQELLHDFSPEKRNCYGKYDDFTWFELCGCKDQNSGKLSNSEKAEQCYKAKFD